MRQKTILTLTLAILIVLGGYQSVFAETESRDQEIDRVMERWSSGMVGEDIDLMMSAYHDDAVLVFAGSAPTEGKVAIRQGQEAGMAEGDWSIFDVERASEPAAEGAERTYTVTVEGEVTLYNSFTYRDTSEGIVIATQEIVPGPPIK
jgi:hypothetical protein